jgi:hypothetical protein
MHADHDGINDLATVDSLQVDGGNPATPVTCLPLGRLVVGIVLSKNLQRLGVLGIA